MLCKRASFRHSILKKRSKRSKGKLFRQPLNCQCLFPLRPTFVFDRNLYLTYDSWFVCFVCFIFCFTANPKDIKQIEVYKLLRLNACNVMSAAEYEMSCIKGGFLERTHTYCCENSLLAVIFFYVSPFALPFR